MERGLFGGMARSIQIESNMRRKTCLMLYLTRNNEQNLLTLSP
jgi:hypothetical protein